MKKINDERYVSLKVTPEVACEEQSVQLLIPVHQDDRRENGDEHASLPPDAREKVTNAVCPLRKQYQKVRLPFLWRVAACCMDVVFLGAVGIILSAALTLAICFLLFPQLPFVSALDMALAVGMTALFIYTACSVCGIWLGGLALLAQITTGNLIGTLVVDLICLQCSIDPSQLGFGRTMAEFAFTFFMAVLPVVLPVLYYGLLESSPWQKTIGWMVFPAVVSDLQGRRLTFRAALKKALISSFILPLWGLAVAAGRSRNMSFGEWCERICKAMFVEKTSADQQAVDRSKTQILVRYSPYRAIGSMPESGPATDGKFRRAIGMQLVLGSFTLVTLIFTLLNAPFLFVHQIFFGLPCSDWQVSLIAYTDSIFKSMLSMPDLSHLWSFGGGPLIDQVMNTLHRYWMVVECIATVIISIGIGAALRLVTHIELSKAGVRFFRHNIPPKFQDQISAWEEIEQIRIEQEPGKLSSADRLLVFAMKDGSRIRMRLAGISSVVAREQMLKAIERWGPTVKRDVEVVRALQPPCDYSYTELWMEALAAPPRRDRLKPLIEGAVVRDDQYLIKGTLGVGGQGAAYLAEDSISGEVVVLKEFLLPVYVDISVRRKALESFEKEARLLKRLSHKQIVTLRDYFVWDHRAYLVLEHIEGESLRDLVCRKGAFGEEQVRQLASQLCDILEYLHNWSPPVVHRDLTPDNLILDKDGMLKLIDFNVAHEEDSATTGSVVGKPAYISPEQFQGKAVPQSDIYSMGASLFFLLTGADPVPISASDPRERNGDVSDELAQFILQATHPDLQLRFKQAVEAKQALLHLI